MPKGDPAAVLGRMLRRERARRRLSLQQVVNRLATDGPRIAPSTLMRFEKGTLNVGATQLFALLRLYEVPADLVADLVEIEELAGPIPAAGPPRPLYELGVEHARAGRPREALACFVAVRDSTAEDRTSQEVRQRALHSFAIVARNLGKYRLAMRVLEELFVDEPPRDLLVAALLVSASLWDCLGSVDKALADLAHASGLVSPDDERLRAMLLHQEATIRLSDGDVETAGERLEQAAALYANTKDKHNSCILEILRIRWLLKSGQPETAEACARRVTERAKLLGYEQLVASAEIQRAKVLIALDRTDRAIALLKQSLGRALMRGYRNDEFLAHYRLWRVYEDLGQQESAVQHKAATRLLLDTIDAFSDEIVAARKALGRHA
jgi:tetratricopeptide (TPR) repeat protein